MFRTIWSKSLRDYRIPALCWGIGLAFLFMAVFVTYDSVSQDQASQGSFTQIAESFRFYGDPIAIDTPEGFTTWRLALFAPVILGVWGLLAGARLVRGEEERGAMDILLSTPNGRARLLVEKLVALVLVLVFIGLLAGLGAIAGEASATVDIRVWEALLTGLNISLLGFFMAALALFLAQFLRSRGAAAGWTGGILVLSILVDGTSRTIEDGEWLAYLTPLGYYNANKPLIPDHDGNPLAALVLFVVALLLIVVSAWLFARRDVGGVALAWHRRRVSAEARDVQRALRWAERDLSCRSVILRALRAQVPSAFWWLLALVGYTLWTTLLTPTLLEPLRTILQGNPIVQTVLSRENVQTNSELLGMIVFQFVPLLTVIFALTQALAWSADLDSGRLELVLSTPVSRSRLQLERFASVFLFVVLAPLLVWGTTIVGARIVDINVDYEKIAAATLGILPLELLIVSFVYALAARLRGGLIMGLVTLYLALAYLALLLRSALELPEWVLSLSIFHSYGSPVTEGWRWNSWGIMLAIALGLLIIGLVQFRRVDVERGA